MKKAILGAVAGFAILAAGPAHADADDWRPHPHCRIEKIEEHLGHAIEQIRESPAMGHAGGHYGRAIEDLEKVKRQLREGCRAWMREHRD